MTPPIRSRKFGASLAIGTLVAGCAPALDWRDIRPAGSAAQVQFPCRPHLQQRDVPVAGVPVKLALHACAAGGQTWGLGVADVGDPARVGPALAAWSSAAAANIAAPPGQPLPLRVPGATPNAASARWRLQGRLPDGTPVQMQLAVFAHGTQVFQATVLGEQVLDEAADNFFNSLRMGP